MIFGVGIHFLIVLTESDIIRLLSPNIFSRFAKEWCQHALRPKEMYTLTTADVMVLSLMPFFFAPFQVFFCVLCITAVSDAMASLVGKTFSRLGWAKIKFKNSNKTLAGLIAGMTSTLLIVILVNILIPFPGASLLKVIAIGLIGAVGFAIIDIYAKVIVDNFWNPIVIGGLVWLTYVIF
jgi:dolichol kinase